MLRLMVHWPVTLLVRHLDSVSAMGLCVAECACDVC
jgi:hypothetical protein